MGAPTPRHNVHGCANGDPVNYSDRFALSRTYPAPDCIVAPSPTRWH